MSYARFDTQWHYHGCRVLRLESDRLCVDVMPEMGGKIYHLIDKSTDRDVLWQHPRIPPRILPGGLEYDDHWCGGWDDLFPSVAACEHGGERYPDHGEYWSRPFEWTFDQSDDTVTLHLQAEGTVTPTRMERWITIAAGSPIVRTNYRLTHLGTHALDYLWSLHPALQVDPGDELIIPATAGIVASPGSGRLANEALAFNWPDVPGRDGGAIDYCTIVEQTREPGYELLYLTQLKSGWFAVLNRSRRQGFGMAFDHSFFNTLCVFQSQGGWRGLHVAVIEPCNGYPDDLSRAASQGRCGRLAPGASTETQVTAVVISDRESVRHIDQNGEVE